MTDLARKFRILADIVQTIQSRKQGIEELKTALSNADLKRTQIESMTILAKEFGFITENETKELQVTEEGLAFERYVTTINSLAMESDIVPTEIDRGTELKVCLTVPPMWRAQLDQQFGDTIEHTLVGEKLVAEDTENCLIIVTPFLDIGIMQVALRDTYAKKAELIIVTSEPNLIKQFDRGNNFWIQKLEGIIKSRFKSGKVLFLSNDTSIAHAKVWCSDRSLLVTSANVKPDSTTDNLEIGVYTDDPELVSTMRSLLNRIVEMEGIRCLLKIPP